MPRDVYIVECVRTPLGRGKPNGMLKGILPVHLMAWTLEEVVKRANLDKKLVEDIVCGCVSPVNEQGGNIGRLAALQAGFPVTTAGVQVNRMCGSGQQAIHFIAQGIASGDIDIGIGCGIEMMSTVKMGSDFPPQSFMKLLSSNFPYQLCHQGQSAEKIAVKYNISRKECDDFASKSHTKAGIARNLGYSDSQVFNIKSKNGKIVKHDEGIRYPSKRENLNKLKTVFKKNGVVTAGNASQITDGSGAVLLASASAVKKYNLKVRGRLLSRVVVGSDPILMLDGVIPATRKALNKCGLTLNDMDLFEINEAFAVVVLAWQKTLGVDWNKVNISGGACAHGHPLGATGAILMTKLIHDLERTGGKYGLQTMCIGWGMATASVIEITDRVLPQYNLNKKSKL